MSDWIKAILLGIIEGVTEFVPVSSTGHMLLAREWLEINLDDPFWKFFVIFIQVGAILAVIVYFRKRLQELLRGNVPTVPEIETQTSDPRRLHILRRRWEISLILLATFPVLAVGYLVEDWVENQMSDNRIIAAAVLIGGIVMLVIELMPRKVVTERVEQMSVQQAVWIGLAQILAVVFPGTSRSAATIIGGLLVGLSRPAAAEFSFFLAIPALLIASGYKLVKFLREPIGMTSQQAWLLVVGTAVSFVVAWAVIAVFMRMIRKYSFIPFAIYRIALGVVVMLVI